MVFSPLKSLVIFICFAILAWRVYTCPRPDTVNWHELASILSFWPFLFACVCLAICISSIISSFRLKVSKIPKAWEDKVAGALEMIDAGSVIVVLDSGVGATTIPFAKGVIDIGTANQVQFVCIDDFSLMSSYPYHPKALLRNLVDVGISAKSVTAHRLANPKPDSETPIVQYTGLPFASGSITLIICDHMLVKGLLRPDFDYECLQELARVLRPGGRLIMRDPRSPRVMRTILERISSQAIWKSATVKRAASNHWIDLVKSDKPNYKSTSMFRGYHDL